MEALTARPTAMHRKNGRQWVLEADITGCCNPLDHTAVRTRLPRCTITSRRWRKAEVGKGDILPGNRYPYRDLPIVITPLARRMRQQCSLITTRSSWTAL
jgi:hypothetical protein